MSLAGSTKAIGAVSELLKAKLALRTGISSVLIGRPESAREGGNKRFNLFLYRISIDGSMRNVSIDSGQQPPVWMALHYLLSAFDDADESDSSMAHELLGRGVVALHEMNFLRPDAIYPALTSNPEPLKLTFDEADPELLSKIMQGSDEKYRLAAAFQVRPVMLATGMPPAYAPAVKTVGPPAAQGVVVLPSLGAVIASIDPESFIAGQPIDIVGTDLAGYTEILLGANSFPAAPTPDGLGLTTTVPLASTISAAAYPIAVARTLPSGRKRTSNAVLGHLRPILSTVATVGPLSDPAAPGSSTLRFGSFTVTGSQMGGPDESIFVALYRNGQAAILLEPQPGGTDTSLTFVLTAAQAIESGLYQVVLRVNSEQAIDSPPLTWT